MTRSFWKGWGGRQVRRDAAGSRSCKAQFLLFLQWYGERIIGHQGIGTGLTTTAP